MSHYQFFVVDGIRQKIKVYATKESYESSISQQVRRKQGD